MTTFTDADEVWKAISGKLSRFFPGSFGPDATGTNRDVTSLLVERLVGMRSRPLTHTEFNQFIHLLHEAGVSEGFFRYYFLDVPRHFYALPPAPFELESARQVGAISTIDQLEWGFLRFYQDALLLHGDIRSAYKAWRALSHEDLKERFEAERFNTEQMATRGRYLSFHKIRRDDRYLISELAVSAYGESPEGDESIIESILRANFIAGGRKPQKVRTLLEARASRPQLDLVLAAGEYVLEEIRSEDDIGRVVAPIRDRFRGARELALLNTDRFLSLANDMDVYVATSMREPEDFVRMADDCAAIFRDDSIVNLTLRYFDPTISAARCAEDKGLVECLMVKSAKALVYFAGHGDSFGKDTEVAMALSLGKPAIIYCPQDDAGTKRARIFRDVHPLSRLIDFETGVACGALVTQRLQDVVELLRRVFTNTMEYDLEHDGKGYFRLRERLTSSVFRLQTNHRLLRESFWNNYHHEP